MRHLAIASALAALLGSGFGCKNTAGRCDCNYDPANNALPATGMTYPTVGAPVSGPTAATPMLPLMPPPAVAK